MNSICDATDVQSLADNLESNNPIERERSRELLIAAGRKAVMPLVDKLKNSSERASCEAAKALAEIKDPAPASVLADALEHDSQSVRWLAAEGLVAVGPEGLKLALLTLLNKVHSPLVREGTHHVISQFAHDFRGKYLVPVLKLYDGFEPAVTLPLAALSALHVLEDR